MPAIEQLLRQALEIDGVSSVSLIDALTGTVLASANADDALMAWNPLTVAAGATELVHLVEDLAARLDRPERLEDIIITLSGSHHLLRLVRGSHREPLLLVATLDRRGTTVAMAHRQLRQLEADFAA